MPRHVTVRAYAKINLHLRVGQPDPESGYHALETLFLTVGLFDTLRIEAARDLRLLGALGASPGGEQNLVWRAASMLRERTGCELGARIRLVKRIPVAAGLAGGSTDAAAALYALNLLWRCGLSTRQLMNIAKSIGADVPFLLTGGAAVATARGDRIQAIEAPLRDWWIVLVASPQGIATPEAFAMLRVADKAPQIRLGRPAPSRELRHLGQAWAAGDWPQPTVNSFEQGLFRRRPRLGKLVGYLRGAGAVTAHVSGSGPTVFGLFSTAAGARTAARGVAREPGEMVYLVRPIAQSPRQIC